MPKLKPFWRNHSYALFLFSFDYIGRIKVPNFEHKLTFDNPFGGLKTHIKRYKMVYSIGTTAVIAGITGLIIGGRCAGILGVPDRTVTTVFARPLFLFSNHNKMYNVVAVITKEGRGHPGFPILCKETGDVFLSQNGAASWLGVSPGILSSHLKGYRPNIDGFTFERLSAIPAIPA